MPPAAGAAATTAPTLSATATPPPRAASAVGASPLDALAAWLRFNNASGMRESAAGAADSLLAAAGPAAADASADFSRAACARFSRCSGISVMSSPLHLSVPGSQRHCNSTSEFFRRSYPDHNGPEMPPSFRTRQKWIAMKMTMMNGRNKTCSTYQRSKVSEPISAPPSKTNLTSLPNTGV